MQQQNLVPVAIHERIQTIDIIRGFAFFGVLIVNFTIDNLDVTPTDGYPGIADQLIYWPTRFFLDDKFLAIYSFLFGLGFSIQMMRAESRNSAFVIVYIRRLLILYFIGLAQAIFTHISVLPEYAMAGFFLLLLYKLPKKIFPFLALLSVLISWGYYFAVEKKQQDIFATKLQTETKADSIKFNNYVGVYQMENGNKHIITRKGDSLFGDGPTKHYRLIPQSDSTFLRSDQNAKYTFFKDSSGRVSHFIADNGQVKALLLKIGENVQPALKEQHGQRSVRRGSQNDHTYKEFVVNAAQHYWEKLSNWSWTQFFLKYNIVGEILPLFLLGLYAGRRKIFFEIESNRKFLQQVIKFGFLTGIVSAAISIGFESWNFIKNIKTDSYSILTIELIGLSWVLGFIAMAMAYVAGLTLLLEKSDWMSRLSFLAPVGRLGLTNYILHIVIYIILFRNFGFGLNGMIGPFWRLMLALPVFIIIVFLSRWWLNYFKMGPFEWLWRSLTYWKIQPIRLKPIEVKNKNGNL